MKERLPFKFSHRKCASVQKMLPWLNRHTLFGRTTGPVWITLMVVLVLLLLPTQYSTTTWENSERVLAKVLSVDNTAMLSSGLIHHGEQTCELAIMQGRFKGTAAPGVNLLQGSLEMDKVFVPEDRVFAVIDYTGTTIRHIQIVDHYRLDLELLLAILFFVLLVVFARGIGVRAILSFLLTILMLWKVLLPAMLRGLTPIPIALGVTLAITASIFVASSGAMMDVAVDITSAVHEVMEKNPTLSRLEAIRSGMNVGRTVVGTMSTTLLLAYSGGYMALLMVFMAQGTPLPNMLNLKYVASELLHTLLGSFGLITVAPLTALSSGWLLGHSHDAAADCGKKPQSFPD